MNNVRESLNKARVPLATYRVQLNEHFTLCQVRGLVDYLDELGISDIYTSPFFQARRHSAHGYDLVDHNRISDALGGLHALEELSALLSKRRMGLLLDFVPNHMGIGSGENRFWMDVLENGASSLYSPFFDIDWSPLKRELSDKVLLPILGDYYGKVLERGELALSYGSGAFFIRYYQTPLPLNPRTYATVLAPMLPPLLERLGEENEEVLELQSIMTGLHNLPTRWETQRLKVIERRREKEILKRRLAALVADSLEVSQALSRRLLELNGRIGEPRSFDTLDALLDEQVYRLGYWRVAAEEINYRRFFDVNDLAAICVERPQVFAEVHKLLFALIERGVVTGLRIDHPDGLRDPVRYFADLQRGAYQAHSRRERAGSADPTLEEELAAAHIQVKSELPLYIVAEKILSRGESLPPDWAVHGTTGYDFTTLVGGLLINEAAEAEITSLYERFTQLHLDLSSLTYEKKKLILQSSLASELNVLAHAINIISERDRHTRDFTLGTLRQVLCELIACFPVYRTYLRENTREIAPHDRAAIEHALQKARRRDPAGDHSAYAFVRSVLLLEPPTSASDPEKALYRSFVMRFQQLTGPVMAKGLEDTAFYIYNRMLSLNEVGGEPEHFGVRLEKFHAANAERQRSWPNSMLTTSTHDTKRSEDVRARISVLSEVVPHWSRALEAMSEAASFCKTELDGRIAPDKNEEHLFYQTLLGTWPNDATRAEPEYVERLVQYIRKATKEAKVNTSWLTAEPEYDAALEAFVRGTLGRSSEALTFIEALQPLAKIVAYHGVFNSLSQTLLKLTSPGVPDLYQGTELWDDSLVDPDNRRPIDYERRRRLLASLKGQLPGELLKSPTDGRIKLFLIQHTLAARRRFPALFGAQSTYEPIYAEGKFRPYIVSFSRRAAGQQLLVIAARLTATLAGPGSAPLSTAWAGATLPASPGIYHDLFSERTLRVQESQGLSLEQALAELPVALLFKEDIGSN